MTLPVPPKRAWMWAVPLPQCAWQSAAAAAVAGDPACRRFGARGPPRPAALRLRARQWQDNAVLSVCGVRMK
eukprot:1139192-Pelagomonas_calceolata.AAC.1